MDNKGGKRLTITDIAKIAGTSVTTVSRVLNDVDYPVSSELKKKVKEAADAANYIPNAMARSLKSNNNTFSDIGIVIPNISNQFYLQTILGINNIAFENGYNLILCNTMRRVEKERGYLRMLYERQVRGVILSSIDENANFVSDYIKKGMKFVLLDQRIENTNCSCINFDSRKGAGMAVNYLISQGHRLIAFATTPLTRWTRKEVFKGYKEALKNADIEYSEELLYVAGREFDNDDSDYEINSGNILAKQFIENRHDATAVLCINDMVAFGFIRALSRNGLRVPEDVSVVGFDDIPFADTFLPPLTTIRYPSNETGKLAAMMLFSNMNNEGESITLDMNLEPRLIIRETVNRIY
jgi:LacI family transcriptional regulator